jgi:hypothetical protein
MKAERLKFLRIMKMSKMKKNKIKSKINLYLINKKTLKINAENKTKRFLQKKESSNK